MFSTQTGSWSMWNLPTLDCWANIHLLNTAISFSRLRSLFCFFFTHLMANNFPVFFSFTMNTSEKAPLLINTQTRWVNKNGFNHTDRDKKSPPVWRNESSLLIRIGELLIKYGDLNSTDFRPLAGSNSDCSQPIRESFVCFQFLILFTCDICRALI